MPPKAASAKGAAKAKAKKEVPEEEAGDRMEAPDRAAFDEVLNKIAEAIEGFQKEQQALKAKIEERSHGKEDYFKEKAELKLQLDEFSANIDRLMGRKEEISKVIGDKRQESVDMRQQLNKMKKSIGYTNEADIDQRIAEIEHKMSTTSITLKEEKDFIKEISELKKRRPQVAKVRGMEDSLAGRDTGAGMKEQIGSVNGELSQYRDGKRQVQEKMKALNESRQEQLGDLPQLYEKRDAFNKKIQEKIAERNELRDEFRQKEREFNQHLKEQREKRQAKAMEERSARQADYNKQRLVREAEKLDEQPYVQEITLIEQTAAFCKSFTATKVTDTKEEKKEVELDTPEGTEVLRKKEDREEEFYFVPTAAKKKGKKKGGKAESGGARPIKHNAVTFKLFDELKLDAPITTDDLPATIEKLDELLASYKEKVKEWEEKREEMKKKILGGVEVDVTAEGDAKKAEEE
jgi:uncharacterized coiled-coil DUF342 family protein